MTYHERFRQRFANHYEKFGVEEMLAFMDDVIAEERKRIGDTIDFVAVSKKVQTQIQREIDSGLELTKRKTRTDERTALIKKIQGMKIPPIAVVYDDSENQVTGVTYKGIPQEDWQGHNRALDNLLSYLREPKLPTLMIEKDGKHYEWKDAPQGDKRTGV